MGETVVRYRHRYIRYVRYIYIFLSPAGENAPNEREELFVLDDSFLSNERWLRLKARNTYDIDVAN